ncbi:MAG: hypothetical protein MH825_01130 [Cyanobacteria bacterium]|nr:hypothetical protein [Cyanobacteriota bacterium]
MDSSYLYPGELIPPVTVVIISTIFAVSFGLVFKDMLEYQVGRWQINRATQRTVEYKNPQLRLAFLGMSAFTFMAMGSSLHVLGFFTTLAYGVGAVVVVPTALFIWFQLGSMFELMVSGGSAAIDIDEYFAATKPNSTK